MHIVVSIDHWKLIKVFFKKYKVSIIKCNPRNIIIGKKNANLADPTNHTSLLLVYPFQNQSNQKHFPVSLFLGAINYKLDIHKMVQKAQSLPS